MRPALATVTHDSLPFLRRFFAGQVAVAGGFQAPLVAVDNGSQDGTVELLRQWQKRVPDMRVVLNPRNMGYAAAVNQAFAQVPGRDVFLFNPDIELSGREQLSTLTECLHRRDRAAVVAPRLLDDDGSTQASVRPFPNVVAMAGHASVARHLPAARRAAERYLRSASADAPARVDWAIGAAMLIRRRAFDEVGGWDERYFLYLEDTDFCLRVARAGWEVWYEPSVRLRHLHDRASDPARGAVHSSAARRHHIASMVRFFARYPRLIFRRR